MYCYLCDLFYVLYMFIKKNEIMCAYTIMYDLRCVYFPIAFLFANMEGHSCIPMKREPQSAQINGP